MTHQGGGSSLHPSCWNAICKISNELAVFDVVGKCIRNVAL